MCSWCSCMKEALYVFNNSELKEALYVSNNFCFSIAPCIFSPVSIVIKVKYFSRQYLIISSCMYQLLSATTGILKILVRFLMEKKASCSLVCYSVSD